MVAGVILRLFHTLLWHLGWEYSNSWGLVKCVYLGHLSSSGLSTWWPQSSCTPYIKAEVSQRECAKRSRPKQLGFSNLASAIMQHHFCILFVKAVIKDRSGSRAGVVPRLFMGGSRRIYGHVFKPPRALRWLMRSYSVVGTAWKNSTLGGKMSFILMLLSLCYKIQVEISCR